MNCLLVHDRCIQVVEFPPQTVSEISDPRPMPPHVVVGGGGQPGAHHARPCPTCGGRGAEAVGGPSAALTATEFGPGLRVGSMGVSDLRKQTQPTRGEAREASELAVRVEASRPLLCHYAAQVNSFHCSASLHNCCHFSSRLKGNHKPRMCTSTLLGHL